AAELRTIEDLCQRDRSLPRYAPRTLDLDLLLSGDAVLSDAGLVLPRPEILQRSYILKPMADLRPDMLHPSAQLSFAKLWQCFDAASHPLHLVNLAL
ncbi:MAG: 2-amino-4-hydroxy-6-hydroxymethyldihydropteridine diphosphokinase, partial [Gammaproteobacteria bacterium]|nr:2-amino-4-hydroxy-6-hydroxymethyldihydropteridine diphosphokinase [Gammaproteobacteria bacterium]